MKNIKLLSILLVLLSSGMQAQDLEILEIKRRPEALITDTLSFGCWVRNNTTSIITNYTLCYKVNSEAEECISLVEQNIVPGKSLLIHQKLYYPKNHGEHWVKMKVKANGKETSLLRDFVIKRGDTSLTHTPLVEFSTSTYKTSTTRWLFDLWHKQSEKIKGLESGIMLVKIHTGPPEYWPDEAFLVPEVYGGVPGYHDDGWGDFPYSDSRTGWYSTCWNGWISPHPKYPQGSLPFVDSFKKSYAPLDFPMARPTQKGDSLMDVEVEVFVGDHDRRNHGDYRLHLFVVEDSIKDWGHQQWSNDECNWSEFSCEEMIDDPYCYWHCNTKGGVNLNQLYHRYVLRSAPGGAWGVEGVLPDSLEPGTTYRHTFRDVKLDSSWNLDRILLGVFVTRYNRNNPVDSSHALNARYFPLKDNVWMVGVKDARESVPYNRGLKIYPNPASKETSVIVEHSHQPEGASLQLFDMQGRIVLTQRLLSGSDRSEISLNGLRSGLYLVRLGDKSGRVVVE